MHQAKLVKKRETKIFGIENAMERGIINILPFVKL